MNKPVLVTFGFPDTDSQRYVNLVKTYEKEGYEIAQCHTSSPGFFRKNIDLFKKHKALAITHERYSALLVTFPGYHLMPLAWLLTRIPHRRLILDAFISVSDTFVSDRGYVSWYNPAAWLFYMTDIISCHLADEVLIDTEAHKKFFMKRFFLWQRHVRVIHIGTRKDIFHPGPRGNRLPTGKFNVLFIGNYIPLHGIEHILNAAKILERRCDIHFTLIGKGQTYKSMRELAKTLVLQNITFLDPMPIRKLPEYIRSCDVALGIFGTSGKARRVIPHKVYDAIACAVPVITATNDAIGEVFKDGKEVFLCEPGNPDSIAKTIMHVMRQK